MVLRILRWTAISLGGLLATAALALAIVVAIEVRLDLSVLRQPAEAAARQALKRPVSIAGTIELIPGLAPALAVGDVTIGNPEGWPDKPFLQLDEVRASLSLLPLLDGRIEVGEVAVTGLTATLERRATGEVNWLPPAVEAIPPATAAAAPANPGPGFVLARVEQLELRNIAVDYRDGVSGRTLAFKLNRIIAAAPEDTSVQLDVQGSIEGVHYGISLTGGSLPALLAGDAPWPIDLSAASSGVNLHLHGEVGEPAQLDGIDLVFAVRGATAGDLERFVGAELPPFGAYEISGRFLAHGDQFVLDDVRGRIGKSRFSGRFPLDLSTARPRFSGRLDIETVDLTPLRLAIEEADDTEPAAHREPADEDATDGEGTALTLDSALFEFDFLHAIDADITLTVGRVDGLKLAPRDTRLGLRIADGSLRAPLAVVLAGVPFEGQVEVVDRDEGPAFVLDLSAGPADIAGLPEALFEAGGIEGGFRRGELALSTQGMTLRDLLQHLDLRFVMSEAGLSYGHAGDGSPVGFRLTQAEVRVPAGGALRVKARGSLLTEPFDLDFTGGDAVALWHTRRWPIELTLTTTDTFRLDAKGELRPADDPAGSRIELIASAERAGTLAPWVGLSRETDLPVLVQTTATMTPTELRLGQLDAQIGSNRITGALGVRDIDGEAETLFANLTADYIDIAEWRSMMEREEPRAPSEAAPAFSLDVPILPQGVDLSDTDLDLGIQRLRTRLVELTELRVSARIRDGHVVRAPFHAAVLGSRFAGSVDLDLRDSEPDFRFDVAARDVDIGHALTELGVIDELDLSAGKVDLEVAMQGTSGRDMLASAQVAGTLEDGRWILADPSSGATLEIALPRGALQAAPDAPIALELDGRIDAIPTRIVIRTDPLRTFTHDKEDISLSLVAELLDARLQLEASSALPVARRNASAQISLAGARIDDFAELFDAALPPWGPYSLDGTLDFDTAGYRIRDLRLKVADSSLDGSFELSTAARPPHLAVSLVAPTVQLDDFRAGNWSLLRGAVEDAAKDTDDVRQDDDDDPPALLSREVLRSLDAEVDIAVKEVLSGSDQLGRGELRFELADGRLSVEPLRVEVPGGVIELAGSFAPGDDSVAATLRATVDRLDYGILARRADIDTDMQGLISLDVELAAEAVSVDRLMAHANGHIGLGIWPRDFEAGVFDLWAVNLLAALLPAMDDAPSSTMNCAIARFQVRDGLATPTALLIDSSRVRAVATGMVDFDREHIELELVPRAKRPQMFAAATPIQVDGDFADFGVSVRAGDLFGTVIRMATSVVVVPLQWVFAKPLPSDGAAACAEAWGQVQAGS